MLSSTRRFRTFSRKYRVQMVGGILGIGLLLALLSYGVLRVTSGAAAAGASPRVGEQLSVFTSAYGQPARIGTGKGLKINHIKVNGVRFYADQAHTIIVTAQPTKGVVNSLLVTGPASWNNQQSFAYCGRFLPTGATAFRTVGQYTYYHSSIGDVVLNNAGNGTCQVAMSPKFPPA